jgi:alkylhydroperoxidase/carboxymuconolactone decarboxylase family protein YurZ
LKGQDLDNAALMEGSGSSSLASFHWVICNLLGIVFVLIDRTLKTGGKTMDEKCRLLIGLGAATAANCVPCFEHYYDKAMAAKLTAEEIQEAVDLGNQMKTGAQMAVRNSISQIMKSDQARETSCCS